MLLLTTFIAILGVGYLALATFLTYKHTVKVPRKSPRRAPHKKVPNKDPNQAPNGPYKQV